jgi:hypothetical protein
MDDLVIVFRAAGLSEAEVIKGFLESAEIPVHLAYESAGAVIGLTVDGLGEVRVKVPADFAPLALELLGEQVKDRSEPEEILRPLSRRPGNDDPDAA